MNFLQKHPFAVEAFFESSIVLTFAIPQADLYPYLPAHLELDSFEGKWGFLAVAMVQTQGLRPKGFPAFLGNDFFLIGYRIFVRYTNLAGKRLRGLYILRSETDQKRMEVLGNIFTHYRYKTIDIRQLQKDENNTFISSKLGGFSVEIERGGAEIPLPAHSPFPDWKTARRFAGPLPFTFSYEAATKRMLIIEGVRQNWTPSPIRVHHSRFDFLDNEPNFSNAVLANAFEIRQIPYHWKKGVIETWE